MIHLTHRSPQLLALTFLFSWCSISYELLLAQTIATVFGSTLERYSFTIGLYIFSLGLGSLLEPRFFAVSLTNTARLVRIELIIIFLGAIAPVAILMIGFMSAPSSALFGYLEMVKTVSSYGFVVAIGVASGFELPILLKLGCERPPKVSMERILGWDFLGTVAGSVVFPLLLVTLVGTVVAAQVVAGLNAFGVGLLCFFWQGHNRLRYILWVAISMAGLGLLGVATSSSQFETMLSNWIVGQK